jgi:hypothetical protein
MATGRRKPHHTHEINDAYAEGWDARMEWHSGLDKPENPYGLTPVVRKQSEARQSAHHLDSEQWQEGWNDCDLDLDRGDLDEVKPSDFRKAVLPLE